MPNPFVDQYDLIYAQAGVVDDLERVRIANENRLRQLTRTEVDKDGEERGFGLNEDAWEVRSLGTIVENVRTVETSAIKDLEKAMARLPIGPYVKATSGLGLKQTARLIAAIGDPYWHDADDRPRLVSELWSYSGYSVVFGRESDVWGVAPKRRKGVKVTWSPTARMRTFLIAESCVKARTSPFRAVYDDAKTKYAESIHRIACERCGPKGKPAEVGSPLSAGHQHGRALRKTGKAVLQALWEASKIQHEKV